MSAVYDPTRSVRRVLWLAYGVLAIALVIFFAAILLLRQHPFVGVSPPALSPHASAPGGTATNPQTGGTAGNPATGASPATNPGAGTGAGGSQASGPTKNTSAQYPPGEPPGDVEDDSPPPSSGSGSGSGSGLPAASLPPLPIPSVKPSVPSVLPTPHL